MSAFGRFDQIPPVVPWEPLPEQQHQRGGGAEGTGDPGPGGGEGGEGGFRGADRAGTVDSPGFGTVGEKDTGGAEGGHLTGQALRDSLRAGIERNIGLLANDPRIRSPMDDPTRSPTAVDVKASIASHLGIHEKDFTVDVTRQGTLGALVKGQSRETLLERQQASIKDPVLAAFNKGLRSTTVGMITDAMGRHFGQMFDAETGLPSGEDHFDPEAGEGARLRPEEEPEEEGVDPLVTEANAAYRRLLDEVQGARGTTDWQTPDYGWIFELSGMSPPGVP